MRNYGVTYFFGAPILNFSGTTVYTRNGKGDVSLNQGNSQTVTYQASFAEQKRVYITGPFAGGLIGTFPTSNEFQELFGTAAGGPANPVGGGGTSAIEENAPFPYGIELLDVFAWYSVQGASLSAGSVLGMSRTVYTTSGASALVVSDIVAPTAIALTLTSAANAPQRFLQAVAQPLTFESSDLADVILELTIVTGGLATSRVYGIGCHAIATLE